MSRFVNVYAKDVNGNELCMSVEVQVSRVTTIMKMIVNKACIVVDAYGYGEYSEMYTSRLSMLARDHEQDMGFEGIVYELHVSISKEPKYQVVASTLNEWDEWLLNDTDDSELAELVHECTDRKMV